MEGWSPDQCFVPVFLEPFQRSFYGLDTNRCSNTDPVNLLWQVAKTLSKPMQRISRRLHIIIKLGITRLYTNECIQRKGIIQSKKTLLSCANGRNVWQTGGDFCISVKHRFWFSGYGVCMQGCVCFKTFVQVCDTCQNKSIGIQWFWILQCDVIIVTHCSCYWFCFCNWYLYFYFSLTVMQPLRIKLTVTLAV